MPESSRSIKRWGVRRGEDGMNRHPGFWSWLLLPLLSNASIWKSGLNKSRFTPPALFKWIASPAFVDALAANVWVEGRSMSVCVYVKRDCQPLRQETTPKNLQHIQKTRSLCCPTTTSCNLLASSLKPVCLVLFYNTFTLLSTKLTICLKKWIFFVIFAVIQEKKVTKRTNAYFDPRGLNRSNGQYISVPHQLSSILEIYIFFLCSFCLFFIGFLLQSTNYKKKKKIVRFS